MQITKKEIIQKLYDIGEKENLNLDKEVQKVIRNEIIPIEVIKLINKYDKNFLQIYDTYNAIYNSRNKNPLYRNLRNQNLKTEEMAIAISSLVTKILISCSKITDSEEKKLFASAMNIDEFDNALTIYALQGNDTKLRKNANQVRELLKILYSD